jgi:hypothetical protein
VWYLTKWDRDIICDMEIPSDALIFYIFIYYECTQTRIHIQYLWLDSLLLMFWILFSEIMCWEGSIWETPWTSTELWVFQFSDIDRQTKTNTHLEYSTFISRILYSKIGLKAINYSGLTLYFFQKFPHFTDSLE